MGGTDADGGRAVTRLVRACTRAGERAYVICDSFGRSGLGSGGANGGGGGAAPILERKEREEEQCNGE